MKKPTILIFTLFFVTAINFNVNAQINLHSLKKKVNKVENNNNHNSKKKNSDEQTEQGSYSQLMDVAGQKSSDGDFLSALKYYKAALAKKSGDYSAKQKVKEMESSVQDKYMNILNTEIEKGDCQNAKNDLDSVMAVMEYWGQEKYYRGKIQKCLANSSEKSSANTGTAFNSANSQAGKIYFYKKFKDYQFANNFAASDEIYAKINMGKTMIDYSGELGLSSTFNAYGFFKFYINDKLVATSGPYSFSSDMSKVWKDFDIPLSINSDFAKKLQGQPELLSTKQDIWLFQQLFIENSINMQFTTAEILNLKNGANSVKVEFGLGEKNAKEPKGIIASGEMTINMDNTNNKELYKRGPKYLRPLDDKDLGNFKFASSTINIGSSPISCTLELPNPPKFYNQYWCKANTCDYDHGSLVFYAELDGQFFASWNSEFDGDAYSKQKSFNLTILPANDSKLEDSDAPFNSEDLFKRTTVTNPLPYAMFDQTYSGLMKAGNHTLKLKVYSIETVPYSATFENTKEYHNKWRSIAETTENLNLTNTARQHLIASSTAKKLRHAGGAWTSVDNYLKTSQTNGNAVILDVAANTKWKITVNVLNVPIYRTCRADILYKTGAGAYRINRAVGVKEDYKGGSYGKPYFTEVLDYNIPGFMLAPIHFPVPGIKVK